MATKTITVNLNGYNTDYSSFNGFNSSYPATNAYADSSSTTYAYALANTTASSTSYVSFTFASIASIPSGATITSVSCNVKYRVSSTSRISSVSVQLYSGSTAKGSATTTKNTTGTVYAITCGTWTRSELDSLMLRFTMTRGTNTNTAGMYIYGSDLTIVYEESESEKKLIKVNINGSWKEFSRKNINCNVNGTWHSLGTTGDVWVKYNETKWVSIYGDYNIDKTVDPVIDPTTGEESKIKEDYEPKGETFSGAITLTGGALDAEGNEKDYIKVVLDLTNCESGNDVWEEVLAINNSVDNLGTWASGVHIYFNNDGGGTSTMHSLTGKCFAIENGSTKKDWVGDQTLDNNQVTIIINSTGVHVYTDEECTNDISTQTLSNANISGSTTVAIGSMEGSGRSNAKFVSIEYVYYEEK